MMSSRPGKHFNSKLSLSYTSSFFLYSMLRQFQLSLRKINLKSQNTLPFGINKIKTNA
jgi:hypothetical protein